MPDRSPSNSPNPRRHRRSRRTRPVARAPLQGQHAQIAITPRAAPPAAPREAEPDYSYVYKDMKSIGMIVGGIVIVYMVLLFTWK